MVPPRPTAGSRSAAAEENEAIEPNKPREELRQEPYPMPNVFEWFSGVQDESRLTPYPDAAPPEEEAAAEHKGFSVTPPWWPKK